MYLSLVSVVLLLGYSQAGDFWGSGQHWSGLRAPWNLNPFGHGFAALPRYTKNDDMSGWVLNKNFCADSAPRTHLGYRYIYDKDPTLMALFDVNGFIAGVQSALLQSKLKVSNYENGHPAVSETINGQAYWVFTVYFVDPSIICNGGRNMDNYNKYGTGDRFLIQNGTTSVTANLVNIPLTESDLQSQWVGPKCFYTMGNHYWFNISPNMECGTFFPFCLLYNGGKLDAFCFANNLDASSPNFDSPHPSASVLGSFMKSGHVPKCFASDPDFKNLATTHVYMTDWPRSSSTC